MSNIEQRNETPASLQMDESQILPVLRSSLYPGASDASIKLVLGYCRASGLDPMQKPVHIVPMWDSKSGQMRDVVMPGIGSYRTQAARTGCAGVSEPEFGPEITERIGGQDISFPVWCRVTVKRRLASGDIVEFTAKEFWKENYAIKGGKEKSIAPNAMWTKRPYGQIAKCAEAQALRKAFPEIGSQPTADEMEGKAFDGGIEVQPNAQSAKTPQSAADRNVPDGYEEFEAFHIDDMKEASTNGLDALQKAFDAIPTSKSKTAFWTKHGDSLKKTAAAAAVIDSETGEVMQ